MTNGLVGRARPRSLRGPVLLAFALTLCLGILHEENAASYAASAEQEDFRLPPSAADTATATPTNAPIGTPAPTHTRTPTPTAASSYTQTPTRTPTATTTPTPPCGLDWRTVSSPNTGTAGNYLYGISAHSETDLWAVGLYYSGSVRLTLTEHWDGSQWSLVNSPNLGSLENQLSGIAVVSTNDVWAVGHYQGTEAGGYRRTLVIHWNGSQWSLVSSPNPGAGNNYLKSIAAVSANDIWAVGRYAQTSGGSQTLAMHWDGSQWSVVGSPNPGSASNALNGVTAVSTADVWAVGSYANNGGGLIARTLAMHWDGSQWSVVSSPNVGSNHNVLEAVDAVNGSDIWAAGRYFASNVPSLTMHWDGSSWSVVPSPGGQITGVSAASANNVWAVMLTGPPSALYWNGIQWNPINLPGAPNELYGVLALAATDVWVVGTQLGGGAAQSFTLHYADPCAPPTLTPTFTSTPIASATSTATATNTTIPTLTRTPTITNTPTNTPTSTPPTDLVGEITWIATCPGPALQLRTQYCNTCLQPPVGPTIMRVQNSAGDYMDIAVPGLSQIGPAGGQFTFGCALGSCLPSAWLSSLPLTLTVDYYNQYAEQNEGNNTGVLATGAPIPCATTTPTRTATATWPVGTFTPTSTPTSQRVPDLVPSLQWTGTCPALRLAITYANAQHFGWPGTAASVMRLRNSGGDYIDLPVPALSFNSPVYNYDCPPETCLPYSWTMSMPLTLIADLLNQQTEIDESNNITQLNPPPPSLCATSTPTSIPTQTSTFTHTRTPTWTHTFTPTATPASVLVGHVVWEDYPPPDGAQPDPLQMQQFTLTLKLSALEVDYPFMYTDASGVFTVDVTTLPAGLYTYRIKGHPQSPGSEPAPSWLAKVGTVALNVSASNVERSANQPAVGSLTRTGNVQRSSTLRVPDAVTTVEMGLMPGGDADNSNLASGTGVDIVDFNILLNTFGKTPLDAGYDNRANFAQDMGPMVVDVSDFNTLRRNFGQPAPGPIGPELGRQSPRGK